MSLSARLEQLIEGKDLSLQEATELMTELVGGHTNPSQIAGVLVALRAKGVNEQELAGFAAALRTYAVRLPHNCRPLVDTCGTGGGRPTFNISTAAAIIAASCGVYIGKHGNRAVTSACGSADVLEALGVVIHTDPVKLVELLESVGIVFMFAPAHHPAMGHVGPTRKELGVRTVFNQLGPLANPADADAQLLGVFSPELLLPMAKAIQILGMKRALFVHGADGLDEISPCGPTFSVYLENGEIRENTIHPADFGLDVVGVDSLEPGQTPADNADILIEAISNPDSKRFQAVLPSAAAAIWLGGLESDLPSAAVRAREAVRSGAARAKLRQLVGATQS